jgi:hypothetical protein
MTQTPNLLIDHIAANQSQKEVTANAAFDALDQALCQPSSIAIADANLTLTDAQMLGMLSAKFTGTLTAARTVTAPAHAKLLLVENGTTGGFAVNVKTPSGSPIAVNSNDRKLLYCDGTTFKIVAETSSAGNPYDIGASLTGQPASGAIILRYPLPRAVRFPASLPNSKGVVATSAAATATFSLKKNGTQFATMQFAASATTATFTAASDTDFAAGDVLTIVAPTPNDTSLADLGVALAGVRL